MCIGVLSTRICKSPDFEKNEIRPFYIKPSIYSMMQATSSKESLSQALQCKIMPNQEYLLQGSIIESAVDHLLHRLRGLCDYVETFHDSEICMSLRQPNQQNLLNARVRRALDRDVPVQLRYIGQPELDRSRPTLVRSSIDVGCTSTVLEFLTELGCRPDFEYVSQGYMFRKGRMKVTVSNIFKVMPTKQHDGEPGTKCQDDIGDEMKIFAEQLKPLVQLEKIDYKRLGNIP